MLRASRLLSKLKLRDARLAPEDLAEAIWPAAVGKRLAARTGPVNLYGRKLVVMVDDSVWQSQLTTLTNQILGKVQAIAGPGVVEHLEFRVGLRRIGPQIALPVAPEDDRADGIVDPIFRHLYLASRVEVERQEAKRMRISA